MGNGERLTMTECVSLADVRIGKRRRRSVNAAKVEQFRQWLEQGRQAPPVRLVRDGAGYVVRDGRHRVVAAVAAGYADIDAVVSATASLILALTRRAGRASSWAPDSSSGGHSPPLGRNTNDNLGMSGWQSASLATRQGGFDSRRLHLLGAAAREGGVPRSGFLVVALKNPAQRREVEGSNPSGSTEASLRSVNGTARALCTAEVRVRFLPEALNADVAHEEEHRVASPEEPVRAGSSASHRPRFPTRGGMRCRRSRSQPIQQVLQRSTSSA
jgi:hypothetical protein